MADPEQEQQHEDSLTESSSPTDAALQGAIAQSLAPVQAPQPTAAPLNQLVPDVLNAPIPEIPDVGQVEPQPSNQVELPNNGVKQPPKQTPVIQVSTDLPGVTLKEPAELQASVLPPSPTPEVSSALHADPINTQASSSTQNMEFVQASEGSLSQTTEIMQAQADASAASLKPVQTPEPSVAAKNAQFAGQPMAEPISETATQPEGFSSEQGHDQPSSQATLLKDAIHAPKGTDEAPSQSGAPGPVPRQTSPVTSEGKTLPTAEIQSMVQEATQETTSKPERVNAASVEQTPRTEAPEPFQVTRPVQQAFTAMTEASQGQPADTSETTASLEPAQSTTPVLSPTEPQATPSTSEAALPRSLDPAPTSVARQIQDSIALGVQQNSRQIVIRLDPPELGRIAIRFQEDSQGITGTLEVQRSQTRYDIQHALPEIIQQLQNSGVQIKRIEVILAPDADTETFEDQAFAQTQDQNLEHQQTSEQYKARRNPAYGWPSSPDEGVRQPMQEQYASDQGINLLL